MCLGGLGIGVKRRKQFSLSFAPVPGHCREDTEIIVRRIALRIHGQKVLQPRARLLVIFRLKIDIDQQFLGARVPRLKR